MTQADFERLLADFDRRTESLQGILRYTLYPVTYYRSNVWQHARRLGWLVQELLPAAQKALGSGFDSDKAVVLALVHDDAEIITGDIQLGLKSKMTKAELCAIEENEERAIDALARRFPALLGPYRYADLLGSALHLDCREALLMKYCDKFDAFGEALHEIFAGNSLFTQRVQDERYGSIPIPPENYIPYLTEFPERYQEMTPFFTERHNLLQTPQWIDFAAVSRSGRPHNQVVFEQPSGYPPYDIWKQSILQHATVEEQTHYWTQKEFQ